MRVFGWAADRYGCGYYRVGLPMAALRHTGLADTTAATTVHKPEGADVIVGQRVVNEAASELWQRLRIPRVFELDDDLWTLHETNPATAHYGPVELRRLAENVAAADVVTCSTGPLADRLRQFNPRVVVVPNYIDGGLLRHPRRPAERVTVGWAGSHTHLDDMRVMARPLRKTLAANRLVDLHLIGADYRRQLGGKGRFTDWNTSLPAYYASIDFDIGLAPLVDSPFNRSKSPVKALEYAALGIPVVASNVGPYRQFVIDGETGFLCSTEQEWADRLRLLIRDPHLRARMGAAARAHAANYTINHHAHEWLDAFQSAIPVTA